MYGIISANHTAALVSSKGMLDELEPVARQRAARTKKIFFAHLTNPYNFVAYFRALTNLNIFNVYFTN